MEWFMDPDGYLPLAVSVLTMPIARPLSERLPPRAATWLITLLAAGTALACAATLLCLVLGGVVQLAGFADYADLPLGALREGAQTSPLVAVLAAVALTAGMAGAAVIAGRLLRARRAATRTARELPGDGRLAVLDDVAVEAFALPGRPGRVVISTGMLAILDETGRRALFAHELAHLQGRHHVFRAITRVAAASNPLLRPLARAVVYSTERWADEKAAHAVGDRALTARALGRAALSTTRRADGTRFTALGIGRPITDRSTRWLKRPGPLPRRVSALLNPAPRGGLTMPVTIVVFLLAATWGPYDLALDLKELLDRADSPRKAPC
jgi:hypothetical protein